VTLSFTDLMRIFPGYLIDYDNEAHYRGMAERRLVLNRCTECGYWIYPISPLCPKCWCDVLEPAEVSGRGVVHIFTLLRHGSPIPGVDFSTPHPIAGIELVEQAGLRYLAPIVNCPNDEIRLDMPVELTWIERAGAPAPAFQPVR